MKIGIFGTGMVGVALGTKLASRGHKVMMGSRTVDNAKAADWVRAAGTNASAGTFTDAAAHGETVVNCTAGSASLEALRLAGEKNLEGKILIDVANPLDFSRGFPPSLTVCNTDSLGEQIQAAFPRTKVVKTLNTMNCVVMVDPSIVPGEHDAFVCGDDPEARAQVTAWLGEWFGWRPERVIDLGDITSARGTEMMLPVWLRLWGTFKTPNLNFHIALGAKPAP